MVFQWRFMVQGFQNNSVLPTGKVRKLMAKSKKEKEKKSISAATPRKPRLSIVAWVLILVAALIAGRVLTVEKPSLFEHQRQGSANLATDTPAIDFNAPALSLEEIQKQRLIIDVHEHIGSLDLAPIYLDIMNELGIAKMCLMGSSKFTLTLDESYGFTEIEANNKELIKIIETYPGRFEAWPTLDPTDPDKLEKFKALLARGATGLKLYIGHGYITKTREYMFHSVAIDDPGMMPVYAYCQENFIPVCMHVNPSSAAPGFAQELIAVLTEFPDMKIVVPHFMLSSIYSDRLREFLDTFPNLYTDISFGDFFMADGLKRISRSPRKFRQIFNDYPTRIMYATDLVLINSPRQNRQWVREQQQAYLDMLTKERYTSPAIPGEELRGLALPNHILERVLYKNYLDFSAKRPVGTVITRQINWDKMNQEKLDRLPGQAFPPPPKK